MAKAATEDLIEAVAFARQSRDALSALTHLLAQAEPGSTIECDKMASLLVLVRDNLGTAVDDLEPITGQPA